MFNFLKKTNKTIYTPCAGILKNLADVPDKVFASKKTGDGFAIEPSDNQIVSPVDGQITMIAKTKHALGIKTKDGTDILLHMGINTVDLDGKPFSIQVKQGQVVHHGQPIAQFNFKLSQAAQKVSDIMVIVPNQQELYTVTTKTQTTADKEVVILN